MADTICPLCGADAVLSKTFGEWRFDAVGNQPASGVMRRAVTVNVACTRGDLCVPLTGMGVETWSPEQELSK